MAAARVFISYRRQIAGGHAGRLFDALSQRIGRRRVFFDESAIEPGTEFPERLRAELEGCVAMVVVIGPGWAQATDASGRRRLLEPGDWVRAEIEAALSAGVRVVPALVGRAEMPRADELPVSIERLATLQAIEMRDATWDTDVERLRVVLGLAPARPWLKRLGLFAAALFAVAMGIGVFVDVAKSPAAKPPVATWVDPTETRLKDLSPDAATQEALVNRFFGQGINVPLLRRFLKRPDLASLDAKALDAALVRYVEDLQRVQRANLYDDTDVHLTGNPPGPPCGGSLAKVKAADFDAALAGWDETIASIQALRRPSADHLFYAGWCQWLAAQVEHLDGRVAAGDARLKQAVDLAQRGGAGSGLSLMNYHRTAARWARERGDLDAAAQSLERVAAALRSRNGRDDPELWVELAELDAQRGQAERSLSWRERAQSLYDARLDPGDARQRANAAALAKVYQGRGQTDAAASLRLRYGL